MKFEPHYSVLLLIIYYILKTQSVRGDQNHIFPLSKKATNLTAPSQYNYNCPIHGTKFHAKLTLFVYYFAKNLQNTLKQLHNYFYFTNRKTKYGFSVKIFIHKIIFNNFFIE